MASSLAFPGGASQDIEQPGLKHGLQRPPHLPFRRISLPAIPQARSVAQAATSASAQRKEEPKPHVVPALMRNVANRPAARPPTPRRSSSGMKSRAFVKDGLKTEKRRQIVNEFVDTEKTYVEGLELIYSHFLMPLIESLDSPHPLVGRTELTTLFSNFIDIWNLHRSFYSSLSSFATTAASSEPPPLSPILMSHFPYLSLYTPFITSFPTVVGSLANLMESSQAFAAFIHTQEADPRCAKLGLRDWLLTIVQRCPRYLLLLKDLITFTDTEDQEHAALIAAHTLLSKITQSLNNSLHTHEQTLSLLALQRATPNLPFQLVSPGRTLLKRGTLLQGQVEGRAPSQHEFLLFSDCLVWLSKADKHDVWEWGTRGDPRVVRSKRPKLARGRSRSENELPTQSNSAASIAIESPMGEERWSYRGRAELVDLEVVVNVPLGKTNHEVEEGKLTFEVLSPEISFEAFADSEQERDEWISSIRGAKASLLVSLNMTHPNSTLTSSEATTHLRRALQALPHAPDDADPEVERRGWVDHFVPAIWVPDTKTYSCMRCGAKFSWRRRRHHCRLCGRCVCSGCSGKTFFISDPNAKSSKPARACNACYETTFPILLSSSSTTSTIRPINYDTSGSHSSSLGTLSQLPSWQIAPAPAPSSFFNPPPSAFHHGPGRRPRPQSQPVMDALSLSRFTSATSSTASVNVVSTPLMESDEQPAQSEPEPEHHPPPMAGRPPPDPRRFSMPALALHTSPVTARPKTSGQGSNKRFSLVLGRSTVKQKEREASRAPDVSLNDDVGAATEQLNDILGKSKMRNR